MLALDAIPSIEQWQWYFPEAFWLLLLLPLFWCFYLIYLKQHWQRLYHFSPMALIAEAKLPQAKWKRLFLPLWLTLILTCLIISIARPVALYQKPVSQVNLMLVMDISLSMLASDIEPTRIEAAKEAAIDFIESLPNDVHVGLELFAGNNYVIESPQSSTSQNLALGSNNHDMVLAYLKSISKEHLQLRTEIGSALKTAVDLLSMNNTSDKNQQKPQQIILLLSDGDSQEGYPWNVAVAHAREQNITINTVGIGSSKPASITYQGQDYPVSFNESTLRQIAATAGGHYFRVLTREDFKTIYQQVKERSIVMRKSREELGYLFASLALLLILSGLAISALWVRRL